MRFATHYAFFIDHLILDVQDGQPTFCRSNHLKSQVWCALHLSFSIDWIAFRYLIIKLIGFRLIILIRVSLALLFKLLRLQKIYLITIDHLIILCDNGEHGILRRWRQGLEAVWHVQMLYLFSKLFRRKHYYVVTIVVASELRDCAVSLKLLLLKSWWWDIFETWDDHFILF